MIFAVFDVLLAVNMSINYSFLHLSQYGLDVMQQSLPVYLVHVTPLLRHNSYR